MNKFIYKMQNILSLKLKMEELEKNNYSIAKIRLDEEIDKLQVLEQRKAIYEEQLKAAMLKTLDISMIKRLEDSVETMKVLIKQHKVVISRAEQAVNLAMQKLTLSIKERKIQEKLRSHAYDNYRNDFELEEKKEIDELVSFQYGVKAKEITQWQKS